MKKLIMSIILATMCVFLCACGEKTQSSSSEDTILILQMKTSIYESAAYLSDANNSVVESIYALQTMDEEMSLICFKIALELVKDVETIINDSISSPNFLSKELKELEENYEKTITLLSKFSELSSEEISEFENILSDGTTTHILLLRSLYALSYLYEIREFDQLPNDVAQSVLKESWWKFGFSNDIQCPETIGAQELYLMWAQQYFGEFDKDMFLQELQVLRENDNLSSSECNQKWTELIENFI